MARVMLRLRRRSNSRLLGKVVQLVQVGLDVAVGECLALLDTQDLAHGLIGVDGVALLSILELVTIHIGTEGTGDIRRGHLRALGLAEEGAQGITEGHRGGEDGGALGNRRGTLNRGGLVASAAATSLLDLARNTLGQAAECLETRDGRITNRLELVGEGLDVLGNGRGGLDVCGRGRHRGSGGGLNRGGDGSRHRGGCGRGCLGLLLLGCRNHGGGGRHGSRGGGGGGLGLLCDLLNGGGLGRGAHCTGTGDIVLHV